MKTICCAIGAALLPLTSVAAQTSEELLESRFRAAEALIDARLARESAPGAAIGVVRDQSLIWSHQYGVESLETGAPVTDDTAFSICSVSKLFTGVATMSLVEDGKVVLDAPASAYIDGAATQDDTGAEEPVTVRNILAHVSGLPREGVADYWADNSFPDTAGLRQAVADQDQLYRPYDYWQYSNLGMAMLGEVVATASGQSWADYVNETIIEPLGMTNTTTDMPFDRVGNGFAQGYYVRSADGQRRPAEPHSFRAFAPAAGVASSINDMARFASWHFRLHEAGGEEILKATTLKQMQRVHWVGAEFDEPAWGLAYATRRYGKKTMWGHGGYCPGTRTEFVMRLPTKTALIMMMTVNDMSPGALVRTVYGLTEDAINAAYADDKKKEKPKKKRGKVKLSDYEGYYFVENYDWDAYIGVHKEGLFALPIFDDDPIENMQIFVHEEGDRFRRKRKDDTLAEPVIFERDENGRVTAVVQHSYRSIRR